MCTKFLHLNAFTVIFLCIGVGYSMAQRISIRVKKTSKPQIYTLAGCIFDLPKSESGHVYKIGTNRNCVNIYLQENCTGEFIRYQEAPPSMVIRFASKWEDDISLDDEMVAVSSIGPCFDKCDPRNWVGMRRDVPAKGTLFNGAAYTTGPKRNFELSGKECKTFTPNILTWESIRISGTSASTCVELHESPTCSGGNSFQLRPGYPYLSDLNKWGFSGGRKTAIFLKSVSLCGNGCPELELATETRVPNTKPPTTTGATNLTMTATNTKEASSNFEHAEGSPVWVDMLTVFVVLFAFGLGGVYFIRRYRKVHLIESYKPCNITYNARTQNI